MAKRYISLKTAPLYEDSQGASRSMVLIFGDEVETTGAATGGRVPAVFRGRSGWITTANLNTKPCLEIYFIDVGQGDSAFIVTPSRKKILIDGGVDKRALGFLAWKYRLDQEGSSVTIDLLVLSHGDSDHLGGLGPIVRHPRITVRQIIHSGIATYRSGAFETPLGDLSRNPGTKYLMTTHDDAATAAAQPLTDEFKAWITDVQAEGTAYRVVGATTGIIDVGDPKVQMQVLGPVSEIIGGSKVFRWFGDPAHTINGHSVVVRIDCDGVSVLLPGDMNIPGSELLLAEPGMTTKLAAHILKAPHHGSHEFHEPFLGAISPQVSVISSGDDPDHGHPRAVFIGAVGKASRSKEPLVFATEIAATFVEEKRVEMSEGTSTDAWGDAARRSFKRKLHGMINVRTDGTNLYAARRVNAGYWWEAYGPIAAVPPD